MRQRRSPNVRTGHVPTRRIRSTALASASPPHGLPNLETVTDPSILATQFVGDRHHNPFELLALAVLSTGLQSLAYHRHILTPRGQRRYQDERAWLLDDNPRHPHSFRNLAEYFDMNWEKVRRLVLDVPLPVVAA